MTAIAFKASLGVGIIGLFVLAGCQSSPGGAPMTVQDIRIEMTRVGDSGDALPRKIRLSFRNVSSRPIQFTAPRPLCPADQSDTPPFPLLGLKFNELSDRLVPAYTDVGAKTVPSPKVLALAPGQAWTQEYRLSDFYFWGPCGPDGGGSFSRYFSQGKRKLTMAAMFLLTEGEANTVESSPITVYCSIPDWFDHKP